MWDKAKNVVAVLVCLTGVSVMLFFIGAIVYGAFNNLVMPTEEDMIGLSIIAGLLVFGMIMVLLVSWSVDRVKKLLRKRKSV